MRRCGERNVRGEVQHQTPKNKAEETEEQLVKMVECQIAETERLSIETNTLKKKKKGQTGYCEASSIKVVHLLAFLPKCYLLKYFLMQNSTLC